MKIENPDDIKKASMELKSDMRIARKMFKDTYIDELKRFRETDKILKPSLKSKKLVTEGDLCLALLYVNRDLKGLLGQHHVHHLEHIKSSERIAEAGIGINFILSILKDITKNRVGSAETKIKKIEKAQKKIAKSHNFILNSVKQKIKSKKQLEPPKEKPIPKGLYR